MAKQGTAYFDSAGRFFPTADEATMSDLAAILGRVGEGDSLAPGIAKLLFQRRQMIEQVFAEHDQMTQLLRRPESAPAASKVTPLIRVAT